MQKVISILEISKKKSFLYIKNPTKKNYISEISFSEFSIYKEMWDTKNRPVLF